MQPRAAPEPTDVEANVSTAWAAVDQMVDAVVGRLPFVAVAVVVMLVLWAVAHGVRTGVGRVTGRGRRANVGIVFGRLSYFAIILLAVLVGVTIVFPSMTPGRMISLLGIGSVAVGFAFKDILQNLLAGVLILMREPFRIGDEITSSGFTGTVEAIETRATHIRTYDGTRVIVPNARLYTEPVSVISAYDMLRSEYDVGIGYGDDVARAKTLVLEVLRATPGVLADPPPSALTWELSESAVRLRVWWWSKPDRPTVVRVRDEVIHRVRDRLREAGVDLPFPTQVVLFHDQTDEDDGDRTRQREGWPPGERRPRPQKIAAALSSSRPSSSSDR